MSRFAPSLLQKTLTIILAGGQGERLFPLTKDRSKPSVPFAGNYRIIDFTLSNCLNSGLRQISVLTQYKSQSLNRHIRDGWSILSRDLDEFIETVPPQHRFHTGWYGGTADAIYQNIYLLQQMKPERILILSGDHIYRMDYFDLLNFHIQKKAQVTISSYEFPSEQSTGFGVMHVEEDQKVIEFLEKPKNPPSIPGKPGQSLVNMGVYVFDTPTLVRAVIEDAKNPSSKHDIGTNVIPTLLGRKQHAIYSYSFMDQYDTPYWRDVGTLDSYFEASMDLLEGSSVNLFSKDWPFRSDSYHLTPCLFNRINSSQKQVSQSMISGGGIIEGDLYRCVLSPEVNIGAGSRLENCIVFNNVKIGDDCKIRNTIIDKNVVIPSGCSIGYNPHDDRKQFMVTPKERVVIPKGMIVERLA